MRLYDTGPSRLLVEKHEQLSYPYTCKFGGVQLQVDEGVFCPTLTNTSPFLLKNIDFQAGELVLDLFSGTGAFGIIAAALHDSEAVTVDKSSLAVRCARKNAALNGVGDRVQVREGDLATKNGWIGLARGQLFDLVIANPPLLPGRPSGPLSSALFDPGLSATKAFIARLPGLLTASGRSYLLTSDVLERFGLRVEDLCADHGLTAELRATTNLGYEQYRIHRIGACR